MSTFDLQLCIIAGLLCLLKCLLFSIFNAIKNSKIKDSGQVPEKVDMVDQKKNAIDEAEKRENLTPTQMENMKKRMKLSKRRQLGGPLSLNLTEAQKHGIYQFTGNEVAKKVIVEKFEKQIKKRIASSQSCNGTYIFTPVLV